MGKVTITLTMVSTVVLLVTFGKGMSILRGGDVLSHSYWAVATLISVLSANFVTIVHARQSDRIIRELRRAIPGEGESEAATPPAA